MEVVAILWLVFSIAWAIYAYRWYRVSSQVEISITEHSWYIQIKNIWNVIVYIKDVSICHDIWHWYTDLFRENNTYHPLWRDEIQDINVIIPDWESRVNISFLDSENREWLKVLKIEKKWEDIIYYHRASCRIDKNFLGVPRSYVSRDKRFDTPNKK